MRNHVIRVNMNRKSDYSDWRGDAIKYFNTNNQPVGGSIPDMVTFQSNGPVGTRSSFSFYREDLEEQGLIPVVERVYECQLCDGPMSEDEAHAFGCCGDCHERIHSESHT